MQQLKNKLVSLGEWAYQPLPIRMFSGAGITFGRKPLVCVVEFHEAFLDNFILRHDNRISNAIKEDL